jgi:hypothetical protein
MFDAVEMMRKTWSGMNVPSSLQPTMDLGEIDRRIADLRVVEQWLQLNQSMLQTTIQTLEIQRNTLAAFQAFSQAGAMVTNPTAPAPASSAGAAGPASPGRPSGRPSGAGFSDSPFSLGQSGGTAQDPKTGTADARPTAGPAGGASIAAAQAALWWDFLQQPFRQMTEAANRQGSPEDQPANSAPPLGTGTAPSADPRGHAHRGLEPAQEPAARASGTDASPSRRGSRS